MPCNFNGQICKNTTISFSFALRPCFLSANNSTEIAIHGFLCERMHRFAACAYFVIGVFQHRFKSFVEIAHRNLTDFGDWLVIAVKRHAVCCIDELFEHSHIRFCGGMITDCVKHVLVLYVEITPRLLRTQKLMQYRRSDCVARHV